MLKLFQNLYIYNKLNLYSLNNLYSIDIDNHLTFLEIVFPPPSLTLPSSLLCWFLLIFLASKHWSALQLNPKTLSFFYLDSFSWWFYYSQGFNTIFTWKSLSPASTSPLNTRLVHSTANLTFPFVCLIFISNLTCSKLNS